MFKYKLNKYQSYRLKTTEMYSLTVQEAGSLTSRCQQGQFIFETLRVNPRISASFWWLLGILGLWQHLSSLCLSSHGLLPCVSASHSPLLLSCKDITFTGGQHLDISFGGHYSSQYTDAGPKSLFLCCLTFFQVTEILFTWPLHLQVHSGLSNALHACHYSDFLFGHQLEKTICLLKLVVVFIGNVDLVIRMYLYSNLGPAIDLVCVPSLPPSPSCFPFLLLSSRQLKCQERNCYLYG